MSEENQDKRTPGPWKVEHHAGPDGPWYDVKCDDPFYLFETIAEAVSLPNAQFIVTACNAHDELVEALRFYADPENYDTESAPGCTVGSPFDDEFELDKGQIARDALAQLNPSPEKSHE